MSQFLWNYLPVISAFCGGFLALSSVVNAAEVQPTQKEADAVNAPAPTIAETNNPAASTELTGQVTSVSQLSDINPSDWAFQALQSLVERYGVISGYPDGTFKGNRALTRYEFAAGLNAALDRLNELIGTSTRDLVRQEDIATLQKLQAEYAPELAKLRGRLDAVEARQAKIEANQFSTTTKLVGDVTFVVADTFGDRANNTAANDTNDSTNSVFSYRARLNFQTSFTGRDQLSTLISANNIPNLAATTGTHMTRFTFDGDTEPGSVTLNQLVYRFPLNQNLTIWVGPRNLAPAVFNPTLNSPIGGLNGASSRFATFNPTVYRPGFDGAGAAFGYKFSNQLQLTGGYIADNSQANQPQNGRGLFNGNHTAVAQLTFSPSRQLDIGLTYTRKYYVTNSGFNVTGGTGSSFARNPFEQNSTITNNFGVQFNWRASRRVIVGGWFGYTLAHRESGPDDEATIINGALTFGFPDLGKKGNLGGIIIGVPPKVTSSDYRRGGVRREDPDTSLHIEAFYNYRVNDNIVITPDFYVITKPEHNDNNDPIWVGVLRTTFTF